MVVRVTGVLTRSGARITRLTVAAPAGSRVRVSCRGRHCPVRRARVTMAKRHAHVRAYERSLRAGVVLEVRVSLRNTIGKYTRFAIRKGRPPARRDACLRPGATRPTRC